MCHPKEASGYARTPMGRSLLPVNTETQSAFTRGDARFTVNDAWQTLTRNGRAARHAAVWQIGSGSHAAGFLVRISGALFQSPVAYYARGERWDVAPGYENLPHIDFNRRITGDCLGCHTSNAPGVLTAVSCDRCHGDGDAHSLRPSKANIVNPARLARLERSSVCEQCHLTGEARVAAPGTAPFRPGLRLEDSVAIFTRPAPGLKVVSHVEQLAQSRCAAKSPQLWCGTCHKAHGEPVNIDAQCRSCHATRGPSHPAATADCASCHMPKRGAVDGLHTAFTDHRIARPGSPAPPVSPNLRPWRPGAHAGRALALALLSAGNPAEMAESFRKLSALYPRYPKDPEVLAGLGFLLFLKDQHADAAKLLEAAIAIRPSYAPYHQKLALAHKALGDLSKAAAALERAIELEPLDETNYHLLAEWQPERKVQILERFLHLNPQHLATREALGRP